LKSDWWEAKAKSLQWAADINDMKSFYEGLLTRLLSEEQPSLQL